MVTQIRPLELAQWFRNEQHGGVPVVLDVREPGEWQLASVKASGFELVCIPMGLIPMRLSELDPTKPIACLCHHGGRSMQVASLLARSGFEHVANIAGGINAWAAELDPSIAKY